MKHFELFFALFAMLALGVGNAWGAEATMTAGTNGSACTVNNINGIKVGTSKAGGDMTITVPAGATSLQLYAATWKGVNGLSINITPESNVNPTSISLTADDGITSNSPFTLNGNAESFKHEVTLSNITSETTLTLTSSTTKRFVVWGATCTVAGGETPGEGGGEDPEEPTPGTGTDGETVTYVFKDDSNCPGNDQTWFNGTIDEFSGWTATKGTNDPKYYTTGTGLRVYNGGKFTITSTKVMTSITLTFAGTSYTFSTSNTTNPQTVTPNAKSYEWSVSRTCRLQKIEITYAADAGGDEGGSEETAASLTANPTSLDFGNVTQNNEVEAKTFTISGSDFTTGELTITAPSGYTVNPTTVSVDGTLGETTITVTPNTSNVGTFNGNVTISGANLKSSVNVALSMTVEKAPATPTSTVYVKVTSTAGITDGEYLIVYEDAEGNPKAPVAFDGSLAPVKLDVASNNIEVSIASNTIAGNTDIDAATFTINTTAGTIQTKDGYYIGQTSNANGLATSTTTEYTNTISIENDGSATIISSGGAYLRYNSANDNLRFRYFKSSTYTAQKAIALYKKVDPNAVVEPVFQLAAGEYYGTQSVEITCATAGAEIYYTLNGTDPTSASTKYTGAISIASTTTIKAVAIKGENSSAVVSATYTILAPLATMQAIFDKATAVGGTATPVHITMNNWVVTGVKNNNVYVTDGTKGLIIYTASHGFNVGDILFGTVACKVQLYNGSSELTELTSTTEGLTVTTGGVVTPVVVNDVTTLGGVNTGSVIKITGPCTVDGTKYYVAGVQLYNSLFAYTNPESGYNYECTGVYLQYNTTKEILPRKAEDLVKIETQQPAGIAFAVTEHTAEVGAADFAEPELTNPNGLTVTYKTSDATLATVNATTGEVTIGNKAGKVTITASFAGDEDYVAADASYNITIADPNQLEATFVAGTDKSDTKSISKNGITVTFTDGTFSRDDNYRCYAGKEMTISYDDGNITKIVFTCDGSNYGPDKFSTETVTYSNSGSVGTWVGDAKSVTFAASSQVRMKDITVYYKQDNRADAGLAWNPATVSLTVGDAFTAPTFSNPNSLTVSFKSDNTALATVSNTGVISLNAGVTGTAVITASYEGDATYKDAAVTCTITVNPKTETVVILAQYNGQWYALKNVEETAGKVLAALPVNYVGGKLYNVADADKATIEWQLAIDGTVATFKNGENYIFGTEGDTNLKLSTTECTWTLVGTTYMLGNRTFFYNETANGFKNYNTSNAGNSGYSNLPVVTAPVYKTGAAYGRTVTTGEYGTICIPYGSSNYTGAEFYEISWMEMDGANPKGIWLDQVNGALTAGKPYIFKATADEIAIVGDGTTAATPVEGVAGLTGTFTLIQDIETSDPSNTLEGNYMISGNEFLLCPAGCWLNANRAYIDATEIANHTTKKAEIPGRRRVCLGETSENEATGFENIVAPEGQAVKAIVNGQLIIIRDGVKYNVQGQNYK